MWKKVLYFWVLKTKALTTIMKLLKNININKFQNAEGALY